MRGKWDWLLFTQIMAIGAISLLIIFAINKSLATSQFVFWVIGLSILYIVSQINYKFWQSMTLPLYILSITLLGFLFILAEPVRGSVRWFDLGIFRVQPSELAKVAAILLLANFYNFRSANNFKNILISACLLLPLVILIFLEPDIGNTLAFLAIGLGISTVAGLKVKQFVQLATVVLITAIFFFEFLAPYQQKRLASFINPVQDPLGTGYNIIQSKIAIGSGLLFGKGFAQGSQSQLNFLPEAESDFIFAAIAEQLGFAGAALLLVIYVSLITRITKIAKEKERYAQLVIAGIVSYMVLQFTINVGMNLGLLPVTGITFPLVSYGGSSLLTTLFLLGIVFAIKKSNT